MQCNGYRQTIPKLPAVYFLMTASALGFLGNTGLLTNQPLLASFAFPWGAILWMLGLVAYGIAILMAKVVPRYVAISIILLRAGFPAAWAGLIANCAYTRSWSLQ